jgi:hypothetical protein
MMACCWRMNASAPVSEAISRTSSPDSWVAVAGGVDQQGELLVGDLGEAAAAGQGRSGRGGVGQLWGVGLLGGDG